MVRYLGGYCCEALRCYYDALIDSGSRAPLSRGLIGLIWLLIPFNIQMVLHPSDVIRFQHWLAAESQPAFLTTQMLIAGEVTALLALAMLVVLLFGSLLMLYRKLQYTLMLWPLAGFFAGIVGNAVWWAIELSQGFDVEGALAGLGPLALVVGCEAIFERLSKDFVFGPGVRPQFEPGR